MSTSTTREGGAVRPALSRCTALPVERFAEEVWARRAHLSRAEELGGTFDDVFSAAAVDELLSTHGLRTPFLRVVRNGQTLPGSAFTRGGGVGATIGDQVADDKLARLFAEGATLVLQGVHRTWPPVIELAQQLGADLGHPVQVNAYVTPEQNQGFGAHYDVHDVFVLQIAGEKHWRIHPPVLEAPLRSQPWTDHQAAVAAAAEREPEIDAVLRPGDALYLPRGYLHSATALGATSIHLTIGVHPWTRHALAERMLAALDRPELRESLPLGVDLTDTATLEPLLKETARLLVEAMDDVTPAAVVSRLVPELDGAARAEPVGPLAQAEALRILDDDSPVRWRRHLRATLHDVGGDLQVRTPETRATLPAGSRGTVERLLTGAVVRVGDLPGDAAARHALADALLRQALVVPAGSSTTGR